MDADMRLVWIFLMVIFLIIEIITLGLSTIWFAIGALAACFVAALGLSTGIQMSAFLSVSLVLLYFTRPLAVKYLNSKTTKTNVEALIGKTARVIAEINNLNNKGQVEINGLEWTARSIDDTVTFKENEYVTIVSIEGVKLIVRSMEKIENLINNTKKKE